MKSTIRYSICAFSFVPTHPRFLTNLWRRWVRITRYPASWPPEETFSITWLIALILLRPPWLALGNKVVYLWAHRRRQWHLPAQEWLSSLRLFVSLSSSSRTLHPTVQSPLKLIHAQGQAHPEREVLANFSASRD